MTSPTILLARLLLRRAQRSLRDSLHRSFLKSTVVFGGSLLLLLGVYAGTKLGLGVLEGLSGLAALLAARIPGLIYLLLLGMLTVSSAVTFLGTFFTSRETVFLHSLRLTRRLTLLNRWQEALFLSSWAFPLIIFPFHIALSQTLDAPTAYVLSFPIFLVPFTMLACAAGALLACGIVALGSVWNTLKHILLVLACGAAVYFFLTRSRSTLMTLDENPVRFLEKTLAQFRLGFSPWSPAGWWYLGAEAARNGLFSRACGFWSALMSSALLLVWILVLLGPGPIYRLYAQRSTGGTGQASRSGGLSLEWLFSFLPVQYRVQLAKDVRLLLRDPGQWAQSGLLFGLMGAYVLSLRGMAYHSLALQWRLIVTTANLAAVAGILTSLGTRFFFPLPSLEAKMSWLIRLAPFSPRRTLVLKLVLAVLWTFPPAVCLAVGTIHFLDLPRGLIWTAAGDVLLMDIALMSLSVGFGALLPEMGQESAAKIVSGLGGTLALLAGLGYVLLASIIILFQLGVFPPIFTPHNYLLSTGVLVALSLGLSFLVMQTASTQASKLEYTEH